MKYFSYRAMLALGLPLAGALVWACSSSNNNNGGGNNNPDASMSGSCANPALQVLFAPMYSAYDGTHSFQVPVVVNGVDPSVVTWSLSDPSKATFVSDPTTGGIMLTITASGQTTVVASAGGLCGASVLSITQAQPGDWDAGSSRYNDGIIVRPGPGGGGGDAGDAGFKQTECTYCHGPTAMGPFLDVAHTPEQTAGFSDQDLINIFTMAMVPDGGYFDPSIVSYQEWQSFHAWDMTSDEAQGLVIYLRSLTPSAQDGTSAFGGHYDGGTRGDGGFNRDGGGRHDGGPPPPDDSGTGGDDSGNAGD